MGKLLRIDVLGPLSVHLGDDVIEVASVRQRCLLGLLALHANETVPLAEIVDVLWEDRPPSTYRTVLQSAVSRLRKILRAQAITSRSNGYTLEIEPSRLDLLRFSDLVARARHTGATLDLYTAALSCWRGPVLADLPERLRHHPTAVAASESRLSTVLAYADRAIPHGAYEEAAVQLRTLAHDEPLHEGLHARLMLALTGVGHQAAALALFTEVRDRLRTELGVEPGEELATAHLKVLRGELPARPSTAQNCLPRDLADFTGRRVECRDLLDAHGAVTAIDGMAGVGKTALAVHLAHQLAPSYPDGQLFLDLHAHTTGQAPLSARDALESLLRQFGVEGQRIPERVDDCAALWRSLAADRRLLLVLDNAADEAQLRPLLPNGRHNRVLITSRSRLTGLEGVHNLCLDVLPHPDAATLFARAFGRSVAGQDDDVAEVLRLCGFLPLAVRIAAAKARAHPSWTVAHLTERLRGEHRRLGELRVGDRSVEAAFALSYHLLSGPQQRIFRLLGDCGAHDFDAYAAAALAGVPHACSEQLLDDLLGAHLLLEPTPGRFRFHDLLRQHARAAAQRDDTDVARGQAQTRLADYYLHTASRAADLLEPSRRRWDLGVPMADLPVLTSPSDAVTWLETEHHNLVTAVTVASAHGRYHHCWQLTQCLWLYFFQRGHLQDWISTHQLALTAVRRAGDTRGEAETQKNLGLAYWRRGDLTKALNHHHEALVLDEGDVSGQAKTHNHLGFIHARMGHHAKAVHHQQLALRHYRAAADDTGQAWAQIGLGDTYFHAGFLDVSGLWFARALDLTRSIGHRPGEVLALAGLGFARHERPLLEQAHQLARAIGDRWSECLAVTGIGICDHIAGATNRALDGLGQAVALARETGDRWALRQALTALGRVLSERGRHDEAITVHEEALALTRALHNEHLEAAVLDDLVSARSSA